MDDPFALELYKLFQGGLSATALSKRFAIPIDRIEQRLKAAATFLEAKSKSEAEAAGRLRYRAGTGSATAQDSVLHK